RTGTSSPTSLRAATSRQDLRSSPSFPGAFLTALCCLSAPQAHIAPVPEAQRLRKQPAGLPVLLECEVSPPGAPVRWLKDGEAVPLDDVIAVQEEGCVRRLLVRSAGPSDSGIYTCDAGDEAVSFVVTVTGWCFGDGREAVSVPWQRTGVESSASVT
uniref:Ig-like domain-containing protein n=1 Tax=Nothoprocta perdicaria TaxID=30464 RepID=A0A8C6Z5Q4_NOTPE